MDELRPGLWTWTSPHPSWKPEDGGSEGWDRDVRSYAVDTGDAFVLIDPLAPPSLVDELASGRDVAVVLMLHMHQRSAAEIVERLGARVYVPAPAVDRVQAPATPYGPGDALPGGLEPRPTVYPFETALWIPSHNAVAFADVVIGGRDGLSVQPDSWLDGATTRDQLVASLRPLLELPVELVLPTHGDPVVEDAAGVLREILAARGRRLLDA